MIVKWAALLLLGCWPVHLCAEERATPMELVGEPPLIRESVSGMSARAIHVAISEMERRGINVTGYRAIVDFNGGKIYVAFEQPNTPPIKALRSIPWHIFGDEAGSIVVVVRNSDFHILGVDGP